PGHRGRSRVDQADPVPRGEIAAYPAENPLVEALDGRRGLVGTDHLDTVRPMAGLAGKTGVAGGDGRTGGTGGARGTRGDGRTSSDGRTWSHGGACGDGRIKGGREPPGGRGERRAEQVAHGFSGRRPGSLGERTAAGIQVERGDP